MLYDLRFKNKALFAWTPSEQSERERETPPFQSKVWVVSRHLPQAPRGMFEKRDLTVPQFCSIQFA